MVCRVEGVGGVDLRVGFGFGLRVWRFSLLHTLGLHPEGNIVVAVVQ